MRKSFLVLVLAAVSALAGCAHDSAGPALPFDPQSGTTQTATGARASGTLRVLHVFGVDFKDGADAASPLIALGGLLYGTTEAGGAIQAGQPSSGTIFSINPSSGKKTIVYRFKGGADGSRPEGALALLGGILYGTTSEGGGRGCMGSGCGTVFAFDPSTGSERLLHHFAGRDGSFPEAGLIVSKGTLYGTASFGGISNQARCYSGCGTVFAIAPSSGQLQILHAFAGVPDGSQPRATLLEVAGTLYGTTQAGGPSYACQRECGTVYAIDLASGQERIVYSFEGGVDGYGPLAGLIFARGRLYGTTSQGGLGACDYSQACGTVFSIVPSSGLERVVYRFLGNSDGSDPVAPLVADRGVLYGTTFQGGGPGFGTFGTIFSIDMDSRQERVLYAFPPSAADPKEAPRGANPVSGLTLLRGRLFGTTSNGGSYRCNSYSGCGTVFSISP